MSAPTIDYVSGAIGPYIVETQVCGDPPGNSPAMADAILAKVPD